MHGLVEQSGYTLFGQQELEEYERFKSTFFKNLENAVTRFASQQGNSFLTDKTHDAITFLKLITQKYDIATANPPYTDSSDFGKELKTFIDDNYKKPYKFNSNLYATFVKRCFDFLNVNGSIGMLHPLTFMYIKSFEDVRKYILSKSTINVLVELGLGGVFANSDVQVDVVMYVLENKLSEHNSLFFDLKQYKNHTKKSIIFSNAYHNYLKTSTDSHAFYLGQSKFKEIKSWPFIYWISDEFRKKFSLNPVEKYLAVQRGCESSDNNRFLRFWWELGNERIKECEYYFYAKGGPYKKWFGNLWMVIDFRPKSYEIIKDKGNLTSEPFYFKKGITSVRSGSKGPSYRFLPENSVFDNGGTSIFEKKYNNMLYSLGFLNSQGLLNKIFYF